MTGVHFSDCPRRRLPSCGRAAGRAGLLALLVISLLANTGCPRLWLPKDLVEFEDATCPPRPLDLNKVVVDAQDFDRTTDVLKVECALDALRKAPSMTGYHAALLASRLCFLLGERAEGSGRATRLGAEGVRWGDFAVANGGDRVGAVHYYIALDMGIAVRHEVVLAIANLGRIEDELKRAMDLDPEVDEGGPVRVLGMLYFKAPSWPQGIGDPDKALELLSNVSREHPEHPLNALFYAQVLWDVQGDEAKAEVRAAINSALAAIDAGKWGWAGDGWRQDCLQLATQAKITLKPTVPDAPVVTPSPSPSPSDAPM